MFNKVRAGHCSASPLKTMNHYELVYLVSATYAEDELVPIKDKVRAAIQKNGGQITTEENLGKKKLAYPVQKVRHGYYLLAEFDLEPEALKKLNNDLKLTGEVLRHLVVTKDLRPASLKPLRMPRPETKPEIKIQPFKEELAAKTPSTEPVREKVSLEELDKKLDKILEGDIL